MYKRGWFVKNSNRTFTYKYLLIDDLTLISGEKNETNIPKRIKVYYTIVCSSHLSSAWASSMVLYETSWKTNIYE